MPDNDSKQQKRSAQNSIQNARLADTGWGNLDMDSYEQLPLAPIDEAEERRRPRQREALLPVGTIYEEEPELMDLKFSLRHILIGQAIIAACLGAMRLFGLFGAGGFAGTLGVLSIIFAALISLHDPDDKRTILVWWALFIFYLLSCIVALAIG